jgi:hypothetical protein
LHKKQISPLINTDDTDQDCVIGFIGDIGETKALFSPLAKDVGS